MLFKKIIYFYIILGIIIHGTQCQTSYKVDIYFGSVERADIPGGECDATRVEQTICTEIGECLEIDFLGSKLWVRLDSEDQVSAWLSADGDMICNGAPSVTKSFEMTSCSPVDMGGVDVKYLGITRTPEEEECVEFVADTNAICEIDQIVGIQKIEEELATIVNDTNSGENQNIQFVDAQVLNDAESLNIYFNQDISDKLSGPQDTDFSCLDIFTFEIVSIIGSVCRYYIVDTNEPLTENFIQYRDYMANYENNDNTTNNFTVTVENEGKKINLNVYNISGMYNATVDITPKIIVKAYLTSESTVRKCGLLYFSTDFMASNPFLLRGPETLPIPVITKLDGPKNMSECSDANFNVYVDNLEEQGLLRGLRFVYGTGKLNGVNFDHSSINRDYIGQVESGVGIYYPSYPVSIPALVEVSVIAYNWLGGESQKHWFRSYRDSVKFEDLTNYFPPVYGDQNQYLLPEVPPLAYPIYPNRYPLGKPFEVKMDFTIKKDCFIGKVPLQWTWHVFYDNQWKILDLRHNPRTLEIDGFNFEQKHASWPIVPDTTYRFKMYMLSNAIFNELVVPDYPQSVLDSGIDEDDLSTYYFNITFYSKKLRVKIRGGKTASEMENEEISINIKARDPNSKSSTISYAWSCKDSVDGDCFEGEAGLDVSSKVLTLPPNFFTPGVYRLTVTCSTGGTSTTPDRSKTRTLTILEDTTATKVTGMAVIESNVDDVISSTLVTRFTTTAQFKTQNHQVNESLVVYQWFEVDGKIDLNAFESTATGSKYLVIPSDTFQPGNTYKIQVNMEYDNGVEFEGVSSNIIEFFVNNPPAGGSFVVLPETGVALTTGFTLILNNWTDVDSLHYQFKYQTEGSSEEIPLTGLRQGNKQVNILLPEGKVTLIGYVYDVNMAFTRVVREIDVTPQPEIDVCFIYTFSSSALAVASDMKDQEFLFQFVSTISEYLNAIEGGEDIVCDNTTVNNVALRQKFLVTLYTFQNASLELNLSSSFTVTQLSQAVTYLSKTTKLFETSFIDWAGDIFEGLEGQVLVEPEILFEFYNELVEQLVARIGGLLLPVEGEVIPEVEVQEATRISALLISNEMDNILNCEQLEKSQAVVQKLAEMLIQSQLPGEKVDGIATPNYDASWLKKTAADTAEFTFGSNRLVVPADMGLQQNALFNFYATKLVGNLRCNPFSNGGIENDEIISDVVKIEVYDDENGVKQEVKDLNTPFTFTIPLSQVQIGENGTIQVRNEQLVEDELENEKVMPLTLQGESEEYVTCHGYRSQKQNLAKENQNRTVEQIWNRNETDITRQVEIDIQLNSRCTYYNYSTASWNIDGCWVSNTSVILDNGVLAIECSCRHLTEFSILYTEKILEHERSRASESRLSTVSGSESKSMNELEFNCSLVKQEISWVMIAVYGLISIAAMVQLGQFIRMKEKTKRVILWSHIGVVVVSIFRVLNVIIYGSSNMLGLSQEARVVLAAIPSLGMFYLLTMFLFSWGSIYYNSMNLDPFAKYRTRYIVLNIVYTIVHVGLYILLGTLNEGTKTVHTVGIAFTTSVFLLYSAMGLWITGRLYMQLDQMQGRFEKETSSLRKKKNPIKPLLQNAIIFSISLTLHSVLKLISIFDYELYIENYNTFTGIGLALDTIILLSIMALFRRSRKSQLATSTKSSRDKKTVSRTGTASSRHSRTEVSKTSSKVESIVL